MSGGNGEFLGRCLLFGPTCFKSLVLYWMTLEVRDKCHCCDSFSQCFQTKTKESSSRCTGWSVCNMKRIAQPKREIAFNLCTVEFSSTCLLLAARVTKQLGVTERPWLGAEALLCFRICDWLYLLRPWKFEVLLSIALGWSFVWCSLGALCLLCSCFFPDSLGFASCGGRVVSCQDISPCQNSWDSESGLILW